MSKVYELTWFILVEQLEVFHDANLLLIIQDGKFVIRDLSSPDHVIERAGAGGIIRNVSSFSLIIEVFTSSSGASTSAAQLCLLQKKEIGFFTNNAQN